MNYYLRTVYSFTRNNFNNIQNKQCWCFHCSKVFGGDKTIEKDGDAKCPHCGRKSVLPASLTVSDDDLRELDQYCFKTPQSHT